MRYALVLAVVAFGASSGSAQGSPHSMGQLSLLAGPSPYDLSGVGTGFAANLGFAWRPLSRILVIEPSLGYFRHTTQFEVKNTWLFPELSVQAEVHVGGVTPFLGGGVGRGRVSAQGESAWDTTIHGLIGARVAIGAGWGLRGELRLRGVGPTGGNTTDVGIGLTYRVF